MRLTIFSTFLFVANLLCAQEFSNSKHIINNEKFDQFTVNLYTQNDGEGLLFLQRKNELPFVYKLRGYDISQLGKGTKAKDLISIIDINNDGNKEIAIVNGLYTELYDYRTGDEKDIFQDEFNSGNYNNILKCDKGDYEYNKEENTIRRRFDAGCCAGTESIHKIENDGSLKLVEVRKFEYN